METKKCTKCKKYLEKSNFCKATCEKDGLYSWCRQCTHEKYLKDFVPKPKRPRAHGDLNVYSKEYARSADLKNDFGILLTHYNQIFDIQKGCCDICGIHQSQLKRALCVDHNHETGEIRGLLCHNCNFIIGFAKDSIDRLNKAIIYLKESRDYKKILFEKEETLNKNILFTQSNN